MHAWRCPYDRRATGDRGSNLYLCKTRLQREIDATDRQIDQLVYELYGNLIPI